MKQFSLFPISSTTTVPFVSLPPYSFISHLSSPPSFLLSFSHCLFILTPSSLCPLYISPLVLLLLSLFSSSFFPPWLCPLSLCSVVIIPPPRHLTADNHPEKKGIFKKAQFLSAAAQLQFIVE